MSRHKESIPGSDPSTSRHEPDGPRYLTLGLNMAGLRCLVVGGGRIGARKAAMLAAAGADVTVVAPRIADSLRELAQTGRVLWRQAEYDVAMLDGCRLIVAATDNDALNLRISSEAEQRGIWCCNVSDARGSRVIFPATCGNAEIAVAVHSHGRDIRKAQEVRDAIAALLGFRGLGI